MSGELPVPDYKRTGEESPSSPPSSSTDLRETVQESVPEQLQRNTPGAEFLVGLFWSAANSFRHDSIVRPFPPMFVEAGTSGGEVTEGEGQKDIEGVRQVLASLPPLNKIASGKATLSTQQSELLRWVINPKRFTVSLKEPSSFASLLQRVDSTPDLTPNQLSQKPKYIFELEYNEEAESKYRSISEEHGVMYAFHGSSVENFYSIVHNGLLNLFNKVAAFGQGTYLSTELGVCLNWSPSGSFWPGGILPHAASCVAMCEVVKHPSVLSRSQIGGEPNIQQKVPEKYFIVTNDEFIRVKYILIYELQKPIVRNRGWLFQHKFVVVLALYLIFLFCVGASQSKSFKKFLRKCYNYFY